MAIDLEALKANIDKLSPAQLNEIYRYIVQHRRQSFWLVPGENLKQIEEIMQPVHAEAVSMTDEEIDAASDEAITEVRRCQTDLSLYQASNVQRENDV